MFEISLKQYKESVKHAILDEGMDILNKTDFTDRIMLSGSVEVWGKEIPFTFHAEHYRDAEDLEDTARGIAYSIEMPTHAEFSNADSDIRHIYSEYVKEELNKHVHFLDNYTDEYVLYRPWLQCDGDTPLKDMDDYVTDVLAGTVSLYNEEEDMVYEVINAYHAEILMMEKPGTKIYHG